MSSKNLFAMYAKDLSVLERKTTKGIATCLKLN
jgi:hypothetical protein